ncbi:MAG: PEP-CTERM sorting domain-containing protein, partial [Alishewanella sp.]|nr:PEP-CTERM sorting domain-containing protein [Alishewanella sp.]
AELVFDTSTLFISDFFEEEFAMESDNLEFNIAAAQVPAPATALLLLAGLACLYRRQQQK